MGIHVHPLKTTVGLALYSLLTPHIFTETLLCILTFPCGRVVITDKQGDVILDRYVRQKEKVFDYRTHVSGITARDLAGSLAQPFAKVQKEVQATIRNRILIGHGIIRHDLKVRPLLQ